MISRENLRALFVARRDVQTDLSAARLRAIDAEMTGDEAGGLQQHIHGLENRDLELAYAARQAAVVLAMAERFEDVPAAELMSESAGENGRESPSHATIRTVLHGRELRP